MARRCLALRPGSARDPPGAKAPGPHFIGALRAERCRGEDGAKRPNEWDQGLRPFAGSRGRAPGLRTPRHWRIREAASLAWPPRRPRDGRPNGTATGDHAPLDRGAVLGAAGHGRARRPRRWWWYGRPRHWPPPTASSRPRVPGVHPARAARSPGRHRRHHHGNAGGLPLHLADRPRLPGRAGRPPGRSRRGRRWGSTCCSTGRPNPPRTPRCRHAPLGPGSRWWRSRGAGDGCRRSAAPSCGPSWPACAPAPPISARPLRRRGAHPRAAASHDPPASLPAASRRHWGQRCPPRRSRSPGAPPAPARGAGVSGRGGGDAAAGWLTGRAVLVGSMIPGIDEHRTLAASVRASRASAWRSMPRCWRNCWRAAPRPPPAARPARRPRRRRRWAPPWALRSVGYAALAALLAAAVLIPARPWPPSRTAPRRAIAAPVLACLLAGGAVRAWRGRGERRDRRTLRLLFSRFVSEPVVEQILAERELFLAGGRPVPQELTATVLFSDVAGFTALCETAAAGAAGGLARPLHRRHGPHRRRPRRRGAALRRRRHPGGVRRAGAAARARRRSMPMHATPSAARWRWKRRWRG